MYTSKQKQYIDSVDGRAHQSAVEIIGQLEAEIAAIRPVAEAAASLRAHNMKTRQKYGASPIDSVNKVIGDLVVGLEEAVDAASIAGYLEIRP
jgi:hypothetical protein